MSAPACRRGRSRASRPKMRPVGTARKTKPNTVSIPYVQYHSNGMAVTPMYRLMPCTNAAKPPRRVNRPRINDTATKASMSQISQPTVAMLGTTKRLTRSACRGSFEYSTIKPVQSQRPVVRAFKLVLTAKSAGHPNRGGSFHSSWVYHR